jgi:hypothetical protein
MSHRIKVMNVEAERRSLINGSRREKKKGEKELKINS